MTGTAARAAATMGPKARRRTVTMSKMVAKPHAAANVTGSGAAMMRASQHIASAARPAVKDQANLADVISVLLRRVSYRSTDRIVVAAATTVPRALAERRTAMAPEPARGSSPMRTWA